MVSVGNRMWKRDVQPELDAGEEQGFFHRRMLHIYARMRKRPRFDPGARARVHRADRLVASTTSRFRRWLRSAGDDQPRRIERARPRRRRWRWPGGELLENCARDRRSDPPAGAAPTWRTATRTATRRGRDTARGEAGVVGGSIEDATGTKISRSTTSSSRSGAWAAVETARSLRHAVRATAQRRDSTALTRHSKARLAPCLPERSGDVRRPCVCFSETRTTSEPARSRDLLGARGGRSVFWPALHLGHHRRAKGVAHRRTAPCSANARLRRARARCSTRATACWSAAPLSHLYGLYSLHCAWAVRGRVRITAVRSSPA